MDIFQSLYFRYDLRQSEGASFTVHIHSATVSITSLYHKHDKITTPFSRVLAPVYSICMADHTPHYLTATNVLIEKDSKVLLSRRQNKGWGDGLLCIPGGHVEPDETFTQAAIREVKEELGIDISENELEYLCTEMKNVSGKPYVSIEFVLRTDTKPKNCEPYECAELVWVDPYHLPEDVIPNFRNIIEKAYVGKEKYIEFLN